MGIADEWGVFQPELHEQSLKSAIIITGHMRSFDRCLPNLWWFVFRHFPDAQVFISTVKDEDSPKAELIRRHFNNVTIEEVETQPEFPELKPWTPGQIYTHEPYAISVSPTAVLRQLWQLERGYELYLASNVKADVIIRCRPDLWFHDYDFSPEGMFQAEAFVPNWGGFGGVNDRFAILGGDAAAGYFCAFRNYKNLTANGCPLHPESLVKASLDSEFAIIHQRNFLFSTLRTNGQMRPPEINASDFLR